jgi:type IV secretory pathway ATPase VirB11/archaellum biosynthesis ATPase
MTALQASARPRTQREMALAHRQWLYDTALLRDQYVRLVSICSPMPRWVYHRCGEFEQLPDQYPPAVQRTLDSIVEQIRSHGVSLGLHFQP